MFKICVYLQAEVVLANILSGSDNVGVTYEEIYKYCELVKEELFKSNGGNECVMFDLSSDSINNALKSYHDIFVIRENIISKKVNFNLDYFNCRLNGGVVEILKKVALQGSYKYIEV